MDDAESVPEEQPAKGTKSALVGAAAIKAHCTLLFGLALCIAAFWFELGRAEGGNELSWAYVFEWPMLAVFAVYMWWKLLHPDFTIRRVRDKPTIAPEFQGMHMAWQAELQKLESNRRAEEAGGAHHTGDGTSINGE